MRHNIDSLIGTSLRFTHDVAATTGGSYLFRLITAFVRCLRAYGSLLRPSSEEP